jgi:hypothetical protein
MRLRFGGSLGEANLLSARPISANCKIHTEAAERPQPVLASGRQRRAEAGRYQEVLIRQLDRALEEVSPILRPG